MITKYRKFKEAVGLSDPDSDSGKLARLKSELDSTLADKVTKAPPIDRPVLRDLHEKALQQVEAKDLAKAEGLVADLRNKLDGKTPVVDKVKKETRDEAQRTIDEIDKLDNKSMHEAFAELDNFKPKTFGDWEKKIARCEAFLQKYGQDGNSARECGIVKTAMLPFAKKQQAQSKLEEKQIAAKTKLDDGQMRKNAELERLENTTAQKAFDELNEFKPANIEEWNQKIARCEAFLEKFGQDKNAAKERSYVETAFLPYALKQKSILEAEEIYKNSLHDKGDQPLSPMGAFDLDPDKMKEMMAETKLNEAEILAIRVFTCAEYEKINPVVANQKDKAGFGGDKKGKDVKIPWLDSYLKNKQKDLNMSDKDLEAFKKEVLDSAAANAGMIHKAVMKLPAKTGTVYRGQRLTEAEFKGMLAKGRIDIETFQSNSTSLDVARDFGNCPPQNLNSDKILCVVTEAAVFSARDIQKLSTLGHENELMLMPDTVLEIQGKPVEENATVYSNFPIHPKVPAQKWFYVKAKENPKK